MAYWVISILFVGVAFGIGTPSEKLETSSVPTVEDVVDRLEEISTKYNVLESSFQEVLKSNTDLQATVVYQASRLQQLQKVVEMVPIIFQDRHQNIEKVLFLEARVAELASNREVTCAETCQGSTRVGNSLADDWFYKIDPKAIELLRSRFKTDDFAKKKVFGDVDDDNDNDYEYNDAIDENAIHTMSKALARLIKSEEENSDSLMDEHSSLSSSDDGKLRIGASKHTKTKSSSTDGTSSQHRSVEENVIENQMEQMLRTAAKSGKKMVFSVGLTKPLLGHPDNPQTVIFNDLKVKRGKGYDVKKGVFTCLIAGVYYFSFTMRSYNDKHIGVALMLNKEAVVTLTTDAAERQVMQSQSVIIKLAKNDEVWVMLGPNQDYAIDGRSDQSYNIFNGLLLFPEK
ncbi:uncharacterized protein LOC144442481 [Glandiceps talaboti]